MADAEMRVEVVPDGIHSGVPRWDEGRSRWYVGKINTKRAAGRHMERHDGVEATVFERWDVLTTWFPCIPRPVLEHVQHCRMLTQ